MLKILCLVSEISFPEIGIHLKKGEYFFCDLEQLRTAMSVLIAQKQKKIKISDESKNMANPPTFYYRKFPNPKLTNTVEANKEPIPEKQIPEQRKDTELSLYVMALRHEMQSLKHELLAEFRKIVAETLVSMATQPTPNYSSFSVEKEEEDFPEIVVDEVEDDWGIDETFIPTMSQKIEANTTGDFIKKEVTDADIDMDKVVSRLKSMKTG